MSEAPQGRAEAGASRPRVLLALGAALGLAAAAVGLLRDGDGDASLPAETVAWINGEPVSAESYRRALAALASDRREPLGERERQRVLERLIDEELLVQRGLELGLARHDRRVRADLVSAVIEGLVAEVEDEEASAREVEAFYREERDYFVQTGRLRVRQLVVRAPSGPAAAERARAQEAAARLRAGEDFDAVAASLGDPPGIPLPDALLPAVKLREYVGPTALRTALELQPGEVSEPVRSALGFLVLLMLEREADRVPPLEEIEDSVRAELRRRAGDRALRAYLERLRARADLRISGDLPEGPP